MMINDGKLFYASPFAKKPKALITFTTVVKEGHFTLRNTNLASKN